MQVLSSVLKLNENLDPSRLFKFEVNMTRAEIADDVSNITGVEINETDKKLTDDFCDKWVRADYIFIKDMLNKESKETHDSFIKELLKTSGFIINKNEQTFLSKNTK
jgi:hypothetical protein